MAAVFAFGKRGANNSAPVSNYLISKGFDFDGVKVGPGTLRQLEELKGSRQKQNISYRILQDAPEAIGLCIDPPEGKSSLAELALPPASDENYLCNVASASVEVLCEHLGAALLISLNAEGISIAENRLSKVPTERTLDFVRVIMQAVINKVGQTDQQSVSPSGKLQRIIHVRKRK